MRSALRHIFTVATDVLAKLLHFSFPAKYGWRWKLAMLSGTYESETSKLFRKVVRPGMVVADVGAHIGYFTRLCAKRVGAQGSVHAFEPDSENLPLLRANTARLRNSSVHATALGAREGEITFYHVEGSTGCHTTIAPEGESTTRSVPITRLDSFMHIHQIPHFDVIKIDVEGGEWDALEGMREALAYPRIQLIMEYNPEALARSGKKPEEILVQLARAGFKVYAIASRLQLVSAPFTDIKKYIGREGSVNVYCTRV